MCGQIVGVSRRSYRARCRFYAGDQRVTYIDFRDPAPGAGYFLGPTCFHPFRDRWTSDPLGPDDCGELDGRRPRYRPPPAPPWMAGADAEGTAEEFLGHARLPAEAGLDGRLPPALVPHCALPPGVALGCLSADDAGRAGLRVGVVAEGPAYGPGTAGLVLTTGSRNPDRHPAVAGVRLGTSSVAGVAAAGTAAVVAAADGGGRAMVEPEMVAGFGFCSVYPPGSTGAGQVAASLLGAGLAGEVVEAVGAAAVAAAIAGHGLVCPEAFGHGTVAGTVAGAGQAALSVFTPYENPGYGSVANAYGVWNGFYASNEFPAVTSGVTSAVSLVLWVNSGETPLALSWYVGTSPMASDVASGTASLAARLLYADPTSGLDVYLCTMPLVVGLAVGTYWLSLFSGVSTDGLDVYWAESDGPSGATQGLIFPTAIPSEYFFIDGGPNFGLAAVAATVAGHGLAGTVVAGTGAGSVGASVAGAGSGVAGGTLILDQFADANGTPLTAHAIAPTNTGGATWGSTFVNFAAPNATVISGNAATSTNGAGVGGNVADCGHADVTITADITTCGAAGYGGSGLVFRLTDGSNYWYADMINGTGIRIVEVNAGTHTQRASAAGTVNVSTLYGGCQLILNGTSITWNAAGLSCNYSSSSMQTNTNHGILIADPAPSTSVDNFKITSP